jgi:bifunctional DNase/RNase
MKEKLRQIKLIGLIIDPVSKSPVMILKVIDLKKIIPIWIGEFEANVITMELEKIKSPRPMTHDLLSDILQKFPGELKKITIDCMEENTYQAKIHFQHKKEEMIIDCRPSDAVILALKNQTDMFIEESIISLSSLSDFFSDYLYNREKLGEWFDTLRIEDVENDIEQ